MWDAQREYYKSIEATHKLRKECEMPCKNCIYYKTGDCFEFREIKKNLGKKEAPPEVGLDNNRSL